MLSLASLDTQFGEDGQTASPVLEIPRFGGRLPAQEMSDMLTIRSMAPLMKVLRVDWPIWRTV